MPRGVYERLPGMARTVFIDYDHLREMIDCGYTCMEAAAEFDCCEAWIRRKALAVGLRFPRSNRPDPQIRLDIIDLVAVGYVNCQRIADVRGVSRTATSRIVSQLVAEKVLISTGKGPHRRLAIAVWWKVSGSLSVI